jgi:branched-chain amino acid transport system substrate-binding protein
MSAPSGASCLWPPHSRRQFVSATLGLLVPGSRPPADIVVGMSAPFTGASRALGIELFRGASGYLEHVNRTAGVPGGRIAIKAYDDGYEPAPAIRNTITLLDRDAVLLLFAYVGIPTVTRILPLIKSYTDHSVCLFCPLTGAQPHRQAPYAEHVFNLRTSYLAETAGLVRNLRADGRRRIGVFYQADAYGRSGWDGVRRALAADGGPGIVAEATYRRGTRFHERLVEQVMILRRARADAVVSIGAYAACAAFIRDAREGGWQVPIANVSFVGSENLAALLVDAGRAAGKDYTHDLINSQVVPSYEDTSLPAVREYRDLMASYGARRPGPPIPRDYTPVSHSFVSFEGFLNAKLLVEVVRRMGVTPTRGAVRAAAEGISNLDLGIGVPISYGPQQHDGLARVYYTTLRGERFVPLTEWDQRRP